MLGLMIPKQRAAQAALKFVTSGMAVGLGTGSTADFFLIALAQAIKAGELREIKGVPTSRQSERRAIELGIPLFSLAQFPVCDITVDGADEVAPNLDLIKGLGGALLREKVVAQNSKKLVIIADEGKVVEQLGTKSPLPVEVAQFGYETQEGFLRSLGTEPRLRVGPGGMVYITDNGNCIYDCHFKSGIKNAGEIESALNRRAGIVESGLFLGIASIALIGNEQGAREMRRT
jgi:ribose 5-phosphate isomerase A